jgi:hypothetical protein
MDPLPKIFKIRQKIMSPVLADVEKEMNALLDGFNLAAKVKPGERVAITAGSRGIRDNPRLMRVIVTRLKALGAAPFIVPCMGSHGGATAEGQAMVLHHLGITEEAVEAPIVSSMEVKEIGRTSFGTPVCIDANICGADKIIVINRTKPHSDFEYEIESGVNKMTVIGMGKHKGALMAHRLSLRKNGMPVMLNEVCPIVRKALPFLFALSIVENQNDETASIHLLEPDNFWEGEKPLLRKAKQIMARLPFKQLDVLVVDEMGKNISGPGMDPNVIGRSYFRGSEPPTEPEIMRIFVRDVTPESEGNANGIGLADYTTKRLVRKIDMDAVVVNCITGGAPEYGQIPISYERDRDALQAAYDTAGVINPMDLRLVWIKNTLKLETIWASEAMMAEVQGNPDLEIISPLKEITFDSEGNMVMEWPGD